MNHLLEGESYYFVKDELIPDILEPIIRHVLTLLSELASLYLFSFSTTIISAHCECISELELRTIKGSLISTTSSGRATRTETIYISIDEFQTLSWLKYIPVAFVTTIFFCIAP
jgi:hypothetical protein